MDIKADAPYPSYAISNFAAHKFTFRGVACNSMEGLLQSFKFENAEEQKKVCQLTGKEAKQKGLEKDWRPTQTLWWQGQPVPRNSLTYQQILDEAFSCLFIQDTDARQALLDTGNSTLQHSIGIIDITQTILTKEEFCSRLEKIRGTLAIKITPPNFPSPNRSL